VNPAPAEPVTKPVHPGAILAVLASAQLILQLDFSIVNVALPDIQNQLGFTNVGLQWVVTGYALTFGSLLLLGGRAGDLFGRRNLLLWGLVLFALTSLASGLAQQPWMLIAARFLQGASGALVAPSALSLLTTTFAEGPARTRTIGIWQAAAAGGASTGVVFGGLLTQYLSWRAIFLVNLPLVAIMLVFAMRVIPRDRGRPTVRLDYAGAALATAALALLIFGMSDGEQRGFGSLPTVLALALAVACGAAFVFVELRVPAPMLRFELLTDRIRGLAYLAMFVASGLITAYVYFISLYLQRVLGYDAALTGLGLIASTITVLTLSIFSTRWLAGRVSAPSRVLLGLLAITIGQLWLSRVHQDGSYFADALPGLVVTAGGAGLLFPAVSILATSGVARGEQGVAAGLLSTSQQVGAAIGLAVLATIAAARNSHTGASVVAGYRLSFLVAALIGAGLLIVLLLGRWRGRRRPRQPDAQLSD
jgi:EmrB/QacA subfamily drug resistance transporter